MKTKIYSILVITAAASLLFSCKKDGNIAADNTVSAVTSAGAIAIGTTASVSSLTTPVSGTTDSLYIVKCYPPRHSKKDSVAFSALPSAIGTYLTANYAGYTFSKAYKVTDSTTATTTYIAVIKYNNNLVGLKFSSAGTFISVLEQRAKSDLEGKGWHDGGPFCNRDAAHRDTLAVTAIPAKVKSFFTATYPTDTLLHAYTTRDTTYMLISKNKGLFVTGISAAGKLVKRVQISARPGKHTDVTQASLPAAINTYLSATYPGYVFNKAFAEVSGTTVQEYEVFITSNSTNIVVSFTAAGVFVKVNVAR